MGPIMQKNKILDRYNYDKESNAYIIPIALDDYNDVFDDWDPSPFKLRDIEDEFLDFLFDSVEDIPQKESLVFEFSIPSHLKDETKEKQLICALQYQFEYMLSRNLKKRRHENLEALKYFVLGIMFFLIAYLKLIDTDIMIFRILEDGLFVGGWVFMWETFSNLFIESRELHEEKVTIKRFMNALIKFSAR